MSAQGYLAVKQVDLPMQCAQEAMKWLFRAGMKGVEGVALFAGVHNGETFSVKKTIIPEQCAGKIEDGLLYVVPGAELHRISVELYEQGMHLFAQIHSHPGTAYHSETDDAYPIVTVLGGISIVVPNFARGNIDLSEWAVYKYLPGTSWTELKDEEKNKFIKIG